MGKIPVDTTGCYVKYTFPNDFVLTGSALAAYQGSGMMLSALQPPGVEYATLNVGSEVFIGNQASYVGGAPAATPNQIVVKGCTTTPGADQTATVKFTGITTPAAAKQTNKFSVVVYHTYSQAKSTFGSPILTAEGVIPASAFTAGTMTTGSFGAPSKAVQARAPHTVAFTLTNALPCKASNPLYNSRIIILMPEVMYVEDQAKPDILSMDNVLQDIDFQRETTFTTTNGDCAKRVCYVITHKNPIDIPKGT